MRQIRRRADAIRDDREPSLDIAATPTMAGGLVGATLARVGMDLPAIVYTQTMSAEHVIRSLQTRTADIGMSAFPLDYAGLEMHVICDSRCLAVLAEDDPLAEGDEVPLGSLRERRMITVGNAYRLRHKIDAALASAGIVPAAEFSTNSSLNAVMAARSGLGVALVDPVTANGIPVAGVVTRPLDVLIPYYWGLFTASGRIVSPLMREIAGAFRTACAEIITDCRFHDPADLDGLKPRLSLAGE